MPPDAARSEGLLSSVLLRVPFTSRVGSVLPAAAHRHLEVRALSPGEHDPTFTVFTATYNRAHLLQRVFDSLERQTYRDFEWLIVDDGSTDDTESIVRDWGLRADFPVRYVRQPHSGKHVAFNRGVREARGRLFLTWDSDDGAVPEALERFRANWDAIPSDRRSGVLGRVGASPIRRRHSDR